MKIITCLGFLFLARWSSIFCGWGRWCKLGKNKKKERDGKRLQRKGWYQINGKKLEYYICDIIKVHKTCNRKWHGEIKH